MPRWISAFVYRACMSAWAWAPPLITMVPDIIRPDRATGTTTITRAIVAMRSTMVRSSLKVSRLADLITIAGSTADRCSGIAVGAMTIGMVAAVVKFATSMRSMAIVTLATGVMTTVVVTLARTMMTTVTAVITSGDIAGPPVSASRFRPFLILDGFAQ